jgi:hypothetical protein
MAAEMMADTGPEFNSVYSQLSIFDFPAGLARSAQVQNSIQTTQEH